MEVRWLMLEWGMLWLYEMCGMDWYWLVYDCVPITGV